MAEFDLTSRMGQYLDRHLVFPLLEFLAVKEIYVDTDLLKGKLDLLKSTNMVDFAMDVYNALYPDQEVPADLKDKRLEVVAELKRLQAETEPITKIFEQQDVAEKIQSARDGRQLFEYLSTTYSFKQEMVDSLYRFGKFQYECGNYSGAAEYLYFVRVLLPPSDKNYLSALWGKLASEILMQNWDSALDDVNRIKEVIDNSSGKFTSLETLQQRTWLIHWSLFVFFNHQKGRDYIIDMFLNQQPYLNAIQTMCPHILRYLTTAVITNKRRKIVLKELVKIIQQESYTYKIQLRSSLSVYMLTLTLIQLSKNLRNVRQF